MEPTTESTTAISPFNFEGVPVRTVDRDGETWFVAADVCSALGLSNTSEAESRLDDDEKGIGIVDTLGGSQKLLIISESGVYGLAVSSRKPEAKRFNKWVRSAMLPAICKTGTYTTPNVPLLSPARLILQTAPY
ncbi:MAG: Bro-N domain-containing protein [Magnetococcales bacterium]|nr:Bro-N domain-containing protein [Magnetococcales bacterium]